MSAERLEEYKLCIIKIYEHPCRKGKDVLLKWRIIALTHIVSGNNSAEDVGRKVSLVQI